MISFKIFFEGTSSFRRLYHYTELSKAADIVTQNRFGLTFSGGAEQANMKSTKRNFFLSTSTIPTGEYGTYNGRYYPENTHVLIEIDATKISDHYKIVPVDYWYDRSTNARMSGKDETEERILSRNPNINNARKYIVAVHVYFPKFTEKEARRKAMAIDEINKIAQSGVNYYIYDNVRSFAGLMTNKAHKLDSTEHQYELWELPRKSYSQDKWDKMLHDAIDWLINPTKENIDRNYLYDDFISSINTDIHNAKRDMRPAAQSALHKLSEYIRKTNKSLKQLVNDAQEKSRKILGY